MGTSGPANMAAAAPGSRPNEKSNFQVARVRPPQRWLLAEPHPEEAAALAREARLPLVLAELLVARGITSAAQAFAFLNPEPAHLHDPFLMLGMPAAVERLERAIAAHEPILLYGDYDVDGTVAVVLLKTAIEMLGGIARFHVPHRLRDGYGMQSSVLEAAHAEGVRVVVTVDTGMRAFAEAETARLLGLDLIITDHHLADAHEQLPAALAILNPNQPGCTYPEKSLCGAAIALKLAQALLERRDPARAREKTLPSFLKMAAIATIADAVPLHGENRTIAALGLRELRRPVGAGLRALFAAAALDPASKQLTGFDVAFRLAPRINAAGRMDVASDVIELFSTRDSHRAAELAAKLERLNCERRDVEAAALTTIETRLARDTEIADDRLLVIDGDNWHRGVIGILASRVVERTAKPAIVITVDGGVAHGSGRSVDGFALLAAIETCSDLFTRFGGHAFAVGFSLPAASLPELKRRLRLYAAAHLAVREPARLLRIHAELPLDRITPVFAGWLRKLEPLGHGNPEPVFIARNARLLAPPRIMKGQHLRLELAQAAASSTVAPAAPVQAPTPPSSSIRAVGWNLAERAMELRLVKGDAIDLAYRIRENDHPDFGGLEVEILGMQPAGL
ncbi:Single-stranded-DNA-specific exonuclease RecJ [Candidatus Sulfotelmatomonas gaucii]|uniref:Single-stranded-DNA-specific exonuclease RecJ n=1 Tax=Candidatus Sulfuritelmatomonas gaucii TaxID=2043161 RepID=A0A2N9LVD3_9BACT|nr:Single-stranded-DNA-specific exonuclease RecJ [Candidatus Sulfotelmatomonas gaucii]